jgi:chorismate mutase/prephenate dehydratase
MTRKRVTRTAVAMTETAGGPGVCFLGPEGTYSHAAALRLFPGGACWMPVAEIPEVFARVESGQAEWGVVPVENSSEGSVLPTLDAFVASELCVAAECQLRINHCLLATAATQVAGITRIASHSQSLGQCRQWLKQHYPEATLISVGSNAEAARLASREPGLAAIAGRTAAELYGLDVLRESIQDCADNTTRFWQIGRSCRTRPTGRDKTSLIVEIRNEAGALFRILEPFHRHGVSLARLESRPSRKSAWTYLFYMDIEGHAEDPPVASALEALVPLVEEIKVLGSYPASAPA